MKYLLILLSIFALNTSALGETIVAKKATPVQSEGKVKIRTAQEDAELRDWIIGIQNLARESQEEADRAQEEVNKTKVFLEEANRNLSQSSQKLDSLQLEIDSQAKALEESIKEKDKAIKDKLKAIEHDEKTTAKNNFLKNILGIQAGFLGLLVCLWLRVPNLSPPSGLVATVASPLVIWGALKFIL